MGSEEEEEEEEGGKKYHLYYIPYSPTYCIPQIVDRSTNFSTRS